MKFLSQGFIFFAAASLVATLIFLTGSHGVELFQYNRILLMEGQWWRGFTGHLVHAGWMHFFLDVGGLLLIGGLFWDVYSPLQWLITFIVGCLAISIGLFFRDPPILFYVGLSGVLNTLFVAGSVGRIKLRQKEGWILLGLIVLKLTWEHFKGPLPTTQSTLDFPIGLKAHLYGAAMGLFGGLLLKPVKKLFEL